MNGRIIRSLVVKDLRLFFKNRFFALITALGVVFFILIYYLLPATVDELVAIGLYAPTLPEVLASGMEEEAFLFTPADSEEALLAGLEAGDYNVAVVLTPEMLARLMSGQKAELDIYFASDVPEEFKGLIVIAFEELGYILSGHPTNITLSGDILGIDMAGQQIAQRDLMLPLLAVFILMMETMGLASLISAEVATGTLQALLVTPVKVEDLFLGKGIAGVSLAFVEAAAVLLFTGGLAHQPLLVLVALLLGALLATGIGFLMASFAKDMMSVMGWGLLAILLLAIPAMNVLLPGAFTNWIKAIPSYYLADTVNQVMNFNAGWEDVGGNLLYLLAFAAGFFALGAFVLRRKFQ